MGCKSLNPCTISLVFLIYFSQEVSGWEFLAEAPLVEGVVGLVRMKLSQKRNQIQLVGPWTCTGPTQGPSSALHLVSLSTTRSDSSVQSQE